MTFDNTHAVAHAGLALVGTLSERLGLEAVVDCIDDADLLRSGATGAVLAHGVMAPSTVGTFLRSLTFGHVRQLERWDERPVGRTTECHLP